MSAIVIIDSPFSCVTNSVSCQIFVILKTRCYFTGKATVNIQRTVPEAVQLKSAGVHIISVAVGGDHNVGMLFFPTHKNKERFILIS